MDLSSLTVAQLREQINEYWQLITDLVSLEKSARGAIKQAIQLDLEELRISRSVVIAELGKRRMPGCESVMTAV